MGNVHLSQRRPEQAVTDFSRAIQLAPEVSLITFHCTIAASIAKSDDGAQEELTHEF